MLYDLNIPWTPGTSAAELQRTLRFSALLGYDVVALNHTASPSTTKGPITNPLPKFPSSSSSSSTTASTSSGRAALPTVVLHRVTLPVSDPAHNHRLAQLAAAYDVVAVRPLTDKAFAAACVEASAASLISLDLAARLPFPLRPRPCMAAVARGARFEVCYGAALDPRADPRARAAFIGNVAQLVRATRGRGIVVSSGGLDAGGGGGGGGGAPPGVQTLRAPADVANLLRVWGLPPDAALPALSALPRAVVANEALRRSGFRGVIDIVGVADREDKEEQGAARTKAAAAAAEGRGGAAAEHRGAQKSAKKRKNGDDADADEAGPAGAGEGAQQQPAMSKRQAKKLKKAAMRQRVDGEAETPT
ncbi:RNase P subunit p30-domain-containing protein [Xylariaceae sp. FL0804]|nr:RNase P subunit p30-domain-containing protein [Xylariaceae sp. FL0804]